MSEEKKKLGDAIFVDIDSNEYLNEIHEKILFNYALRLFQLEAKGKVKEFDLLDALRFADLLSKSNHPEASARHKMWAQEIIKVHTIFTYAKTHITNRFIIFDGDQKPTTEIPDFSEVLEKDKTLIYYKDVLREVVGVKADSIAWGMDANSKSGRKNEDQEKTLLVEYLEFFRDNVRFLPKLIPEDLIFNSDKLQAICGDLPPVDSIDDSKAKLKAVADSTGYDFGNLISILTTSFIKTKNEDYQYILALLKSIIER